MNAEVQHDTQWCLGMQQEILSVGEECDMLVNSHIGFAGAKASSISMIDNQNGADMQ